MRIATLHKRLIDILPTHNGRLKWIILLHASPEYHRYGIVHGTSNHCHGVPANSKKIYSDQRMANGGFRMVNVECYCCLQLDRSIRSEIYEKLVRVFWLFHMAKYIELLDTMFIIFKKKEQNLSFLHIYHHSTIVFFAWINVKWFPTGDTYAATVLNSGVHVLMYSYYCLALLNFKIAKYIWLKKSITILQLIQFSCGVVFLTYDIMTNCNYHRKWLNYAHLFYLITFLILFNDRIKGWPMVDSVWHVFAAIIAYNLIVYHGVEFMKNRKPFKLKGLILFYNISVLLLNAYTVTETILCITSLKYNFFCNENTRNSRDPIELRLARAFWLFYLAKYIELMDTMFTVVKKNEKNLSFLHIYHHSSILFFIWIHVKWFPTGNSYLLMILNSGGHVIMYTYYTQCLLGPKFAKYLWWKKYITILQIIQFYVGVSFCIIGIIGNCNFYPKWYIFVQLAYVLSFLILFNDGHTLLPAVGAICDKWHRKAAKKVAFSFSDGTGAVSSFFTRT
uniref:Elongation of very long chain fatty acids protein n=2 Tax=Lutzomyia longipalpis TaxID=7200 RepID=A0A1B0CCE1_LUTLO